jgi:beta-galactosidase
VARYAAGDYAGEAAVTRRAVGTGSAWYLSADLDPAGRGQLLDAVLSAAGVAPTAVVSAGVEAVRRTAPEGDRSYLFLINHSTSVEGWAQVRGTDLLTGAWHEGPVVLPGLRRRDPGGAAPV